MSDLSRRSLNIASGEATLPALLVEPPDAWLLYVLAHGAGAGMRHSFMEAATAALARRGIATLRYEFPYMAERRRRPDPPPVAHTAVRAAVEAAREESALPLIAGGKSFGGRMTSQAQAERPLPSVLGLAFLGFPLHAAGRPDDRRAAHLGDIAIPMLFLQGTRDTLADLSLMRPLAQRLESSTTLKEIEGADHSFHVLKRSGRTDPEAMEELAGTLETWGRSLLG